MRKNLWEKMYEIKCYHFVIRNNKYNFMFNIQFSKNNVTIFSEFLVIVLIFFIVLIIKFFHFCSYKGFPNKGDMFWNWKKTLNIHSELIEIFFIILDLLCHLWFKQYIGQMSPETWAKNAPHQKRWFFDENWDHFQLIPEPNPRTPDANDGH